MSKKERFKIGDAWVIEEDFCFSVGVESEGIVDYVSPGDPAEEIAAKTRAWSRAYGWPLDSLRRMVKRHLKRIAPAVVGQ